MTYNSIYFAIGVRFRLRSVLIVLENGVYVIKHTGSYTICFYRHSACYV